MENTKYTSSVIRESGRFSLVAKKILIEQRRTLLIMLGSYLGACMIIGLWFGYLGMSPRAESIVFYVLVSGLACALVASKMFFDLTSKEGRIALLMTPAKASDIFLTRLAGVLPGMLLLVAAGYIVYGYADILAYGLEYDQWMQLPNPFKGDAENPHVLSTLCGLFALFLFNESIFIFGAVVWPRRSFLKSLGVFAAIQILFFVVCFGLSKVIAIWHIRIEIVDSLALGWIINGCVAGVAILIIWWAYRRFKCATVA